MGVGVITYIHHHGGRTYRVVFKGRTVITILNLYKKLYKSI